MPDPAAPSTVKADPAARPVVLVPACNRLLGEHPFNIVGKKYLDAVRLAGCLPFVVPEAEPDEIDAWLDRADGLLLTGSPSNVHPMHYGEEVYDPSLPLDPLRDIWTLPMIQRALGRGLPLFAICRGFQEVIVALGGSLHQAVQDLPGKRDHRSDDRQPVEIQYGPSHPVIVQPGGVLARLLGTGEVMVNSLHGQGANRLPDGALVEALAPDDLVEAFSLPRERGFTLCVQWHPEWLAASNPVSTRMLGAFGAACQDYRDTHRPPSRPGSHG